MAGGHRTGLRSGGSADDGLDRPVRVLLPKQGSEARRYVHRRYDNIGNLTHVTVPVTENSLSTILAEPAETRKWVDAVRALRHRLDPTAENQNGPVIFDYTPEGWQTSRKPTRPAGDSRDTFRTYYRDGLLETFADEKNNLVLRQYDRNGNLTFLRTPASRRTAGRSRSTSTTTASTRSSRTIATGGEPPHHEHDLHATTSTACRDPQRRPRGGLAGRLVRAARRNQFTLRRRRPADAHEDFGRGSGRDRRQADHADVLPDRPRARAARSSSGSAPTPPARSSRGRRPGASTSPTGCCARCAPTAAPATSCGCASRHSLGYRDPGGVFVNGHRTSDDFFRKSPRSNVPCQLAADNCVQRWRYDGGDRLVEENDGHGNRTSYKLAAAGGIEEKRNAETGRASSSSADFDGTRIASVTQERRHDGAAVRRRGQPRLHHVDGGTRDDCNGGDDPSPQMRRGVQLRLPQPAVRMAVRQHDARPTTTTRSTASPRRPSAPAARPTPTTSPTSARPRPSARRRNAASARSRAPTPTTRTAGAWA